MVGDAVGTEETTVRFDDVLGNACTDAEEELELEGGERVVGGVD